MRSGCCACAASSQPAAAPPSSLMNARRKQRLPSPEAQDRGTARRLWEISARQCAVRPPARQKRLTRTYLTSQRTMILQSSSRSKSRRMPPSADAFIVAGTDQ